MQFNKIHFIIHIFKKQVYLYLISKKYTNMKKYKNFIINNFHSNKNFAILTNYSVEYISQYSA